MRGGLGGQRHGLGPPLRVASAAALALALAVAAGCAAPAPLGDRDDVIRRILAATVQLRCERSGGVKRAASGVVVAADPRSERSWIVTARHLVDPPETQQVYVALPGRREPSPGFVRARSTEFDLAIVEVRVAALPPVRLKEAARLGDEVWVVSFPWGRRQTLVSAVISQLGAEVADGTVEGPPRMVDASVSYGSSGGGVYDAVSGRLVGIVESYRTARVRIPETPNRTLELPVAGETTLVSAQAVVQFFRDSGLAAFLAP
jgi:S1-C subfamily serine protease